ncbi:death domain-containing protein CRADD-like protein [Dinothrombium tinctorium]|uniref:Death domain-containing protein CRADD-like protein n=1 Tax=Dinothrombium tinctorium TaxID=1965070 RepID=A0A3S3P4R0_9ACAR|nr:death domain-containing protein CRADD-like protein [Dinothrombium tinctorium]RWS12089.1 death domain-containing protein CRADD-like protein [Dinothrombium tinctorium]RWS12093.1 death domain-containing protein CRADD-like protein [Dinothrombium tinctorium]
MNESEKRALRKLNSKLVDSVKAIDIVPRLVADGILTLNDAESISSESEPRAKMQKLLFILPLRGPLAFSHFRDSLREDYFWLYEQLVPDNNNVEKSHNAYREFEVSNEVIDVLKHNCHVVKNWTLLGHALGLPSTSSSQIQIQANILMWDLKLCVVALFEKWKAEKGSKANVGSLLDILRREQFNDVADDIERLFT